MYAVCSYWLDHPRCNSRSKPTSYVSVTEAQVKFDGDNRLQFLSGFPEVAAHFGFSALLYDEPPMARPILADDWANLADVIEWD